ncbi:MAG TPA: hypothetical protein VFS21_31215 [Roseiflexaceae bacterium]|nr:hypothetical protein [Roseiflexaceae bacterium]
MTDVPVQAIVGTEQQVVIPRRVRVGSQAFWLLFAIEAAVVAVLLAVALVALLPPRVPLAQATDTAVVREAVLARLNGDIRDPLVEIGPGTTVRASNLRGLTLNGAVYYYTVQGQQEGDPLSRGLVTSDQVQVVLRDGSGPAPLVVYQIVSKNRATY